MTFRLEGPRFYAWDPATGDPLAGGKVYFYEKGTTTPKTTWADQDKAAANANPVILNAAGEAPIYLDGDYKVRLDDASDVTVWTQDGISSPIDATGVQTLIDASIQAVLPTYDTQADLAVATVANTVERVRVLGYDDVHDAGGAEFIRVASAPAHLLRIRSTDRFLPGGATDSGNGGWWEIGNEGYSPLVAGAVGDAVVDDASAIDAVNDPTAPSVHIDLEGRTYEYVGTFTQDASRVFTNGKIVDDATTHDFFPLLEITETGGILVLTDPALGVKNIALTATALRTALGLPANPNDGSAYVLQEKDDALSWVLASTVGTDTIPAAAGPVARWSYTTGDPTVTNTPDYVTNSLVFAGEDVVFQGTSFFVGTLVALDPITGAESTPTYPFTIPAGSWYEVVVTAYPEGSGGGSQK